MRIPIGAIQNRYSSGVDRSEDSLLPRGGVPRRATPYEMTALEVGNYPIRPLVRMPQSTPLCCI